MVPATPLGSARPRSVRHPKPGLVGAAETASPSVMNVLDLLKATIICGLSAFLIYSFPVLGQVVIIGVLSLLWLSYAHRTLAKLLRR